jgi:plastocyanin
MVLRGSVTILASIASLLAAMGAAAEDVTVDVGHNRIAPAEVTIAAGEAVQFRNQDEMPGGHTLVANDGTFASPGLAKGEAWEYTFKKPGVYLYHLKEHPNAIGKVVVLEQAPAAPAPER